MTRWVIINKQKRAAETSMEKYAGTYSVTAGYFTRRRQVCKVGGVAPKYCKVHNQGGVTMTASENYHCRIQHR